MAWNASFIKPMAASRSRKAREGRTELKRHRQATAVELRVRANYEPVLGDVLHPGAGVGEALPAEVDPGG
jgi:hypothetical protein